MSEDIIYEKIHVRHDAKWSLHVTSAGSDHRLLCVACVTEMMESDDIASVRRSFALSAVSGALKCSPGRLRELLLQDHRVAMRFTASFLGILHSAENPENPENPATVEKAQQVLVQLLLELRSEAALRFVLDETHKQLSDQQLSLKGFLPAFHLLAMMVEAVPGVARCLVTQYVPLLERLCSALLYPDESLKASATHVWLMLFRAGGGSAVQSLPVTIRDRVCILLRQTLADAGSPQLIRTCAGLLWTLVQNAEMVSVLMNSPRGHVTWKQNQNLHTSSSQNQEQQPAEQCQLPLILKQLLLSGDKMLQLTAAKSMASVLVHSPSQYSAPFIMADLPEFLFDRMSSSSSESLLWSTYSCLLLLTEDSLFFSHCHSVYGIESLVFSVREALRHSNPEVQKQGLLLLTQILERQPPGVRLFPSAPGFAAVSELLVAGVSSPCLLVATQSVSAGSALFRLQHQSQPVQYSEVEKMMEAVSVRFPELPLLSSAHSRSSGSVKRPGHSTKASRSEGFLLQALVCFQAACRLAEACASEPVLKENAFTAPAPAKASRSQGSLQSLCHCLLHSCDSIWIPIVTRMSERVPNAQVLQYFYSILASQFTLLPAFMPVFAKKLASSGFFRLALEHKGLLCAGNRNPELNVSCCCFLQKLSMCLLSQSDPAPLSHQHDAEEVEDILQQSLSPLCCHVSDWPSLLYEAQGPRATQYCLLVLLHLALQNGDRLLPEQTIFSSVLWLLHSVQDQGYGVLPHSVLRSTLYLLAVTQDMSPNLDQAPLNLIIQALSSCRSVSSLYFHRPALLHFVCRYPELAEKFGPTVLELWLTGRGQRADVGQSGALADKQEKGEKEGSCGEDSPDQEPDAETMELLHLMEKHPAVLLMLLDLLLSRGSPLAERALGVLEVLLRGQRNLEVDLCGKVRAVLLQALQKISAENTGRALGGEERSKQAVTPLPLLLKLLCVTLASEPPSSSSSSFSSSQTDGVHLKLLYHVSTIAGRLKPTDIESLLPALNYLYCCLSLSPDHCTDRAASMLLSNTGLMEQLQTVASSSSTPPSAPPPPTSLLCCSHLLLSSLITVQRLHSAQVHKSISWSLDAAVQRLLLHKRNTHHLLLVSYLRLLQALLDADLASSVVGMSSGPGLVGPRPLSVQDSALYPLGLRGAQCLSIALSGLLLQRQELLLRASLRCFCSLLRFVQRKSPLAVRYVVSQPWTGFLLHCLLGSGECCLLHPAILRLVTCLLQQRSEAVRWEPHLLRLVEAVDARGVKELGPEAALTLELLLTQVQSGALQHPLSEQHKLRVRNMMEELSVHTSGMGSVSGLSSDVLRVGDVSVCLSDFTLTPLAC